VRHFSLILALAAPGAGQHLFPGRGERQVNRVWAVGLMLLVLLIVVAGGRGQTPTPAAPQIYVTEDRNHRLVRIDDMTGAGWITLGTQGGGANQFSFPAGIFVEATGRIYMADGGNNRIVRVDDMTGAGWTSFGTKGSSVNQFSFPAGVAVDGAGRIYVADYFNRRIVRMDDMTGAGWVTFGTEGSGVNQFGSPSGISLDAQSRIHVVDLYVNERLVRINEMSGAGWTTLSIGIRQLGLVALFALTLEAPFMWAGSAIDASGRIYVADYFTNRVVRIDDMSGVGRTSLGSTGAGVRQFRFPAGIAIDATSRIYVADALNNRIVRMDDIAGAGWTTLGAAGSGVHQFLRPSGIFVYQPRGAARNRSRHDFGGIPFIGGTAVPRVLARCRAGPP